MICSTSSALKPAGWKSKTNRLKSRISSKVSPARRARWPRNKHIKLETYTDLRLGAMAGRPRQTGKNRAQSFVQRAEVHPGWRASWNCARKNKAKTSLLIVNDNGIGIAEKNLPFIFDRFWQADSSSQRKYPGRWHRPGAGEGIDRDDARRGCRGKSGRQRHDIHRAVAVSKGGVAAKMRTSSDSRRQETGAAASEEWLANLYRRAEFFPAMAALRAKRARSPWNWANAAAPVVLLADDEPDMRRFLRSHLDEHYDVLEAADGVQALEKTTQFFPDIILLDMMMPENGRSGRLPGIARRREDTPPSRSFC